MVLASQFADSVSSHTSTLWFAVICKNSTINVDPLDAP